MTCLLASFLCYDRQLIIYKSNTNIISIKKSYILSFWNFIPKKFDKIKDFIYNQFEPLKYRSWFINTHMLSIILETVGSFLSAFKLFCKVLILSESALLFSSTYLGSPKLSKILYLLSSLNKIIWRVSWDCLTKKNPIILGTLSLRTLMTILKYPFNLSLI